jgi:hypothetical protein
MHQVIVKDVGDMDEIIFLFFQILSYNQIDFTSIFIFRGFLNVWCGVLFNQLIHCKNYPCIFLNIHNEYIFCFI